ncbi:hypothetical protein ACFV2Z_37085 [Streptomyces sp. NPDC059688]
MGADGDIDQCVRPSEGGGMHGTGKMRGDQKDQAQQEAHTARAH